MDALACQNYIVNTIASIGSQDVEIRTTPNIRIHAMNRSTWYECNNTKIVTEREAESCICVMQCLSAGSNTPEYLLLPAYSSVDDVKQTVGSGQYLYNKFITGFNYADRKGVFAPVYNKASRTFSVWGQTGDYDREDISTVGVTVLFIYAKS